MAPSWSSDGRWIYFCSNRNRWREIYKTPAEGGQAVQVTTRGDFEGFESPDGQSHYFTNNYGSARWRQLTSGGEETLAFNAEADLHA